MKTRWPWITLLLGAAVLLNPVGIDFFRSAFLSSEQLTRNIAGPLYLIAVAALAALVLIEWGVRLWMARRRAARAGTTES